MTDPKNEVLFCEYCKTCKHKLCDCEDEPCCDCLAAPVNYYSHKPVLWEGVDTLFNKPVERRNHEVERAVREALCLECSDIAEPLEVGSTPRHKINMKSILSEIAQMVKDKYGRDFTWEELTGLLKMFLSYDDRIMEMDYYSPIFGTEKYIRGGITGDYINCKIERMSYHGCYDNNGSSGFNTSIRSYNILQKITNAYLPNVKTIGPYTFIGCDELTSVYTPMVKNIDYYGFYECRKLKSIALQSASYIGIAAFYNCYELKTVDIPQITKITSKCFYDCKKLKSIYSPEVELIDEYGLYNVGLVNADFPKLTKLYDNAFNGCSNLEIVNMPLLDCNYGDSDRYSPVRSFQDCSNLMTVNMPSLTYIADYMFYECRNLKHITVSETIDRIGRYAFCNCKSLENIPTPNVRVVDDCAFKGCNGITSIAMPNVEETSSKCFSITNLKSVNLPKAKKIYGSFNGCTNLETVNLPNAEIIGDSTFGYCTSLTTIELPNTKTIGDKAFCDCTNLSVIRMPNVKSIGSGIIISGCSNVQLIDLSGIDSIPTIKSDTFSTYNSSSPDRKILVPTRLYKILGITPLWKNYSFRLIYDKTPVYINTTIENGSAFGLGVDSSDMDNEFMIGTGEDLELTLKSGDETSTIVSAIDNGVDISDDIIYVPAKQVSKEYQVASVSGAAYGFALNSNGYYESQNKGIGSSAAVCRITFNTDAEISVVLKVINSGENNYDYGAFSDIDTAFTTTNSISSSYWNGKGKSSTNVVDVTYTIPAGKHFIDAKFIKDGSGNSGKDSLQFKVTYASNGIIPAYYTYTLENVTEDHNINVVFGDAETSET